MTYRHEFVYLLDYLKFAYNSKFKNCSNLTNFSGNDGMGCFKDTDKLKKELLKAEHNTLLIYIHL